MNEMLERATRAICHRTFPPYPDACCGNCSVLRKQAIAVIKALREPTKEMRSAEGVHDNCHMCGGHIEGWQHLIDEILK